MVIVYYKDQEGKITYHHGPREGQTADVLRALTEEYNQTKKENQRTAYVEEVDDDSLAAYLFRKAAERKKRDKEELDYAISSIEDALQAVRSLED